MSTHLVYQRGEKVYDLTLNQAPSSPTDCLITLDGREYYLHGDHEELAFLISNIQELTSPQGIGGKAFEAKLLHLSGMKADTISCPLLESSKKVTEIGNKRLSKTERFSELEETKRLIKETWIEKDCVADAFKHLCEEFGNRKEAPATYKEALAKLEKLKEEVTHFSERFKIFTPKVVESLKEAIEQIDESNFEGEYQKAINEVLCGLYKDGCLQVNAKQDKLRSELFSALIKHYQGELKLEGNDLQRVVINAYLEMAVDYRHFSGTALITRREEALFEASYGMATEYHANSPNTVFHVGSVTKQFTAAAIMLLHEWGKINLDKSINEYLPEKYRCKKWEGITVHHLLTHTSGIADYQNLKNWCDEENGFLTENEMDVAIATSQNADFLFSPPGESMEYCNLGYTLLGKIIENLSYEPYAQFIQEHLLKPLEMTSSAIHTKKEIDTPSHAKGHRWDKGEKKLVLDDENSLAVSAPDGGLYTTSCDLIKWGKMVRSQGSGVLSPESIAKMTTPTQISIETQAKGGYGYGLGSKMVDGKRRFSHPGWIPGFRGSMTLYPEQEVQMVLLCNNTHAVPEDLSEDIEDIFFQIESLTS